MPQHYLYPADAEPCEFIQEDDSEWRCTTHDVTMIQKAEPVKCVTAREKLPNIETFDAIYAYCPECQSLVYEHALPLVGMRKLCSECRYPQVSVELNLRGWFYWFCVPSSDPDTEPFGPFADEEEALKDAREGIEE